MLSSDSADRGRSINRVMVNQEIFLDAHVQGNAFACASKKVAE
jgi:hypothetical protein